MYGHPQNPGYKSSEFASRNFGNGFVLTDGSHTSQILIGKVGKRLSLFHCHYVFSEKSPLLN